MRVYALTLLGKRLTSQRDDDSDEMHVLHYIRQNKTATDDELEILGASRTMLERLKKRGLLQELTH